jgi:inner membrane protein
MDPLTHAISGAVLARAFPKHPLPRKQLIFLMLVTMMPDADVILRLFSDIVYLQHHRGLTHSLLMIPLWCWLVYSLSSCRIKQQPMMPWLIGGALLLHICLDLITSYGTMVLAPFSDWRASLDLVYIIDPLFTACLLLPLLLGLIWKQMKRWLASTGFILMLCYLGLAWINQQQAIELAKKAHPDANSYNALPLAFSPFNWQLIAVYPDYYARAAVTLRTQFSGTRSLFGAAFATSLISTRMTGPDDIFWQKLPAMHTLKEIDKLPGTAFYAWFARYPVLLKQDETFIKFGDLAFGGGAPGVRPTFQLYIDLKGNNRTDHTTMTARTAEEQRPRAWLIWRKNRKSELTPSSALFDWLRPD